MQFENGHLYKKITAKLFHTLSKKTRKFAQILICAYKNDFYQLMLLLYNEAINVNHQLNKINCISGFTL